MDGSLPPVLATASAIADLVAVVELDLARCATPTLAALLILASACTGETTAPAPAAPTQPPVVVLIPAPVTTSTAVAVATAEPASATSVPDPQGLQPSRLDRGRPAIENYAPVVQLDNILPLNAAPSPFGTYINSMHNRIHPLFAEEFLGALSKLPQGHQLNQDLVTDVEIVIDKTTGRIVRMGITRPSGVTVFDLAVLSAVDRASPFGKAPDVIASPDGNVYFHWEFHRDAFDACTTRNARPFLLKRAP